MQYFQIAHAVDAAKVRLKALKQKYPKLDAYLVFSSPLGQAEIGAGFKELIAAFPKMFRENDAIKKALALQKERYRLEQEKQSHTELDQKLDAMAPLMEVDDEVEIAIRFGELQYDLIQQLREDDLVDRVRTPQTRASIHIVLGTLRELLLLKPL